ncbi:DinB family protein [Terribacillus saccharophilus]|uniref:DinB family protein n=1 Tax=Terribacillus saccharophilus TaxID=361277 RepID=UPI003982B5E1
MKSKFIKDHFDTIYKQRKTFEEDIYDYRGKEWIRPVSDKWSIGETYYHLYLLIKRFRQLNKLYIPIGKPFSLMWKHKPYKTDIEDIYSAYKAKKGKAMKAPNILQPPKNSESKPSLKQITKKLDMETEDLENMVAGMESECAGHIRYPDPLAHNPNLIQSICLIGIHEQHHFKLCKKYYRSL